MKCKATTKAGKPCKANAMQGSDYCVTHAKIYDKADKKDEPPKPPDAIPKSDPPKLVSEAPKSDPPVSQKKIDKNSLKMGEFSMEERRKNVSLVSGIALLLSITAILLFGWSQITYSPYHQGEKDKLDRQIDALEKSVFDVNDKFNDFVTKDKKAWQLYQLKKLQNTVEFVSAAGSSQYKADFDKINNDIRALLAKVEGPKKAAAVAAPAKAKTGTVDCPMAIKGDCPMAIKGDCPKMKAAKAKAEAEVKKAEQPKAEAAHH